MLCILLADQLKGFVSARVNLSSKGADLETQIQMGRSLDCCPIWNPGFFFNFMCFNYEIEMTCKILIYDTYQIHVIYTGLRHHEYAIE